LKPGTDRGVPIGAKKRQKHTVRGRGGRTFEAVLGGGTIQMSRAKEIFRERAARLVAP